MTGDEEVAGSVDGDSVGGKGSSAACVTQLANGEEGGIAKGREEVGSAGSWGQIGNLEVNLMG